MAGNDRHTLSGRLSIHIHHRHLECRDPGNSSLLDCLLWTSLHMEMPLESRPVALYPLRKGVHTRSSSLIRLICRSTTPDWRRRHLCFHRRPRVVRYIVPCSPLIWGSPRRITCLRTSRTFYFNLIRIASRLPASEIGMIIDKGVDFPQEIDATLRTYGESMWFFREQPGATTTRALNTYTGDHREYVPRMLTPRTRVLIALDTRICLLPQASNTSPLGYR